jgi:outer membrane protein OmpA-like peptidoglycan-associated protein
MVKHYWCAKIDQIFRVACLTKITEKLSTLYGLSPIPMVRFYGFVLVLGITSSLLAQTTTPEILLVPVTSKPSNLLRLQFAYENDSVKVWATNLGAMPIALKKARIANPKVKFNYALATAKAAATIERNYAFQRDTSYGFRTKLTGQSYYNVLKTSFLSGKGSAPIFINQNINLGGFRAPATWPTNFQVNVSKIGLFSVNYVPSTSLRALPVFDGWNCVPATDMFYKLRALQGYGLEKITYKPYNARRRETVTKAFDIYFESNSTQPKQTEIKAITDYLEQNRFEILNAVMTGGSSVEGDATRNKQLQRDRARVISAALSRYNKSAIKKDTILLHDNWPKFREQIKASKYAWLDTLSNEKIQAAINLDESLRTGLENVLKTQRKASLSLTMAKILTVDDQFVNLKKLLNSWLRTLLTTKQPSKDLEPQIMGAIGYLFEQHVEDVLSREEVDSLLMGDYPNHKSLYLGLHIIKQFNEGKFGPEDQTVWGDRWAHLELEPWILEGQQSLVRLMQESSKADFAKYLKMQADFQSFAYRMISLGILDINFICSMKYPETNEYMNLLLNHHAFMYEMYSTRGLVSDCAGAGIRGFGDTNLKLDSARHCARQDSIAGYNPLKRDSLMLSLASGLPRGAFQDRRFIKPTFGNTPKGEYYFMLKQGFLKGNKNILSNVEGNLSLDAISLFRFLRVNLINWDPEQNYFYDKEVRLEELDRLVAVMKKGTPLCAPQVNGFYLEYHRKALQYLELYFEPGSAKHKEIAESSLKFITEYYKKRIPELRGDFPLKLAMYLNRFNWFPGNNEGAWYGYDLLTAIAKKRKLTPEEQKLFVTYIKIYNPEFKVALPAGYTKESVMATQTTY